MKNKIQKNLIRKEGSFLIIKNNSIKKNNNVNSKIVSIYSNLPSGGAGEIANIINKFLATKLNTIKLSRDNIKPNHILDYLFKCIFLLPRIHKELATQANSSDVLLAYQTWLTNSPLILRYTKIPKVFVCAEPMREYYDKEHIAIQNFLEKIINIIRLPIKFIDKENFKASKLTVVSNSKHSKKLILSAYNLSSKVIYPGIETKIFDIKSSIKRNQVISVGSINKLKGYHFVIKVLSLIPKKTRPNFVIVGNGANTKYLLYIKKLAKDLGVTLKVKLNISKDNLVKEYSYSKVFLYAPVSEPFGIVVLEAMASGLPLVVYKYGGGYAEILNYNNGYVINNLNPKVWAYKLSALLRQDKMKQKISKYNKKYVNKYFDASIMNEKILKLINHL